MMVENVPVRLGNAEVELCSIGEAEVLLSYPDSLSPWLSAGEQRALAGLKTPKRKRDWLAARLAAKRVIGRRMKALGRPAEPADIVIANHDTREPFVADEDGDPDESLPISLSHAGDYGACALGAPGTRIGMDLERIEPRDPAWRELMADDSELEPDVLASSEALTRLWTAKEAVLKLLGVGLSVDLRGVMPRADGGVQLSGASLDRWNSLGANVIELHFTRYHDCCLTVALSRR